MHLLNYVTHTLLLLGIYSVVDSTHSLVLTNRLTSSESLCVTFTEILTQSLTQSDPRKRAQKESEERERRKERREIQLAASLVDVRWPAGIGAHTLDTISTQRQMQMSTTSRQQWRTNMPNAQLRDPHSRVLSLATLRVNSIAISVATSIATSIATSNANPVASPEESPEESPKESPKESSGPQKKALGLN